MVYKFFLQDMVGFLAICIFSLLHDLFMTCCYNSVGLSSICIFLVTVNIIHVIMAVALCTSSTEEAH